MNEDIKRIGTTLAAVGMLIALAIAAPGVLLGVLAIGGTLLFYGWFFYGTR